MGSQAVDRIDYDPSADVLYLTVGDPADAVHFDESLEGHGPRFDTKGQLVGITIVGARSQLKRNGSATVTGPVAVALRPTSPPASVATAHHPKRGRLAA